MKKVSLIVLIPFILLSCGPKETAPPASSANAPERVPQETLSSAVETDTVTMDSLREGLVVFTSGDVFLTREGEEEFLDIGDPLGQDDVVATGEESYCEIQLGEMAVLRMEENSIITMNSLLSREQGNRVSVALEEGQVLCKVKKLLEDDSFKVQAGTVVCGVRGTEFGVSAKGDAEVLLAVKEGAVSVIPQSLDQVSELAVGEKALQGVAAKIQEASFVVGASEEMAIEKTAFDGLEDLSAVVEEVVKNIEEKKASAGSTGEAAEAAAAALEEKMSQEIAVLLTAIEDTPEVVAPALLETKAISEKSLEQLASTEHMELISFTPPATTPGQAVEQAEPSLPVLRKINLLVEPAEVEILVEGQAVAKGAFSRLYAEGKSLNFTFRLAGYKPQTLNLVVQQGIQREYRVILEPEEDLNVLLPVEVPVEAPVLVDILITAEPSDASITVDGVPVGTGSWTGQVVEGTALDIRIERNGYAPRSLPVTAAAGGMNQTLRLEPRPLEVTTSLSSQGFVGSISEAGEGMIGADARGQLTAFDRSGKVLWQYQSRNTPNANSSPVVSGNRVYFSGAAELAVLNRADGTVRAQYPLGEERSHIFGRQVVPLGEQILYPANEELILMDKEGNEQTSFPLAGSSSMSPSVWNNRIVIADKKGTLLVMDSSSGETVSSILTGSLQAVAQSPAIRGNLAVFASRKGIVSAVNLEDGKLLWERKLNRTIFASILAEKEGCFVYTTKQELFALSWETGEDLFAPLEEISSVPGYDNGSLYMTDKSGMMKILNAGNGRVEKIFELKDSFSARPIIRSGVLFGVGTEGSFYRINTAGIP